MSGDECGGISNGNDCGTLSHGNECRSLLCGKQFVTLYCVSDWLGVVGGGVSECGYFSLPKVFSCFIRRNNMLKHISKYVYIKSKT